MPKPVSPLQRHRTDPARTDRPFSRPVMSKQMQLQTGHAQRVMHRTFAPTARAIGRIETIMLIISGPDEAAATFKIVGADFDRFGKTLDEELARVRGELDDNGIDAGPAYSHPLKQAVTFSSPGVFKLISLLERFDTLMIAIDTAWFAGLVDNEQRADTEYEWRKRFMALTGSVVRLERRAREAAERSGKDQEVQAALAREAETVQEDAPEDGPAGGEAVDEQDHDDASIDAGPQEDEEEQRPIAVGM